MVLEKIKVKKTLIGKSQMTSGNAYRVTLTYNGKKCSMVFNDNYRNGSDIKDFIYSLLLDAAGYDNVESFMREFGYKEYSQGKKIYNACKRQYEKLTRLFNEEEINELEEFAYN